MATSPMIRRATSSLVAMFMSRIMPGRPRVQVEVDARLASVESKEEIRSVMIGLAKIVDDGLLSDLSKLEHRLHPSFTMRVVDIAGAEKRLSGAKALVDGYAPIMASGRSRLIWSAIAVDVAGDRALASFKLAGAIKSSPELGLRIGQRVLLVSGTTATLVRERGVWKLVTLELVHSMAYPEMQEAMGVTMQEETMPKGAKKTRSRGKRVTKA